MHISAKSVVIITTKRVLILTPPTPPHTIHTYIAGLFLRYYLTEMQRAVLPLPPLGKRAGISCPPVPALLTVFEKIYIYRHDGIVVRAFASQLEDLGSTLLESDQKTEKIGIYSFLA